MILIRRIMNNNHYGICNAIVIVVFCFVTSLNAQYNNNWLMGDGVQISFSTGQPSRIYQNRNSSYFESGTSISNKDGDLVFYTDHKYLFNKNHQLIFVHQFNGDGNLGTVTQGILGIPIPYHDSAYYLLTMLSGRKCGLNTVGSCVKYHTLKHDASRASGFNIRANLPLFEHGFRVSENLTAVKHANGEDWWIVFHELQNNKFLFYRADSQKIAFSHSQNVGGVHSSGNLTGQFSTTLDGTRFLSPNGYDVIDIFDFNRCSGMLTHIVDLEQGTPPYNYYGCAFSPSGRFVYISGYSNNILYQYDLLDANPPSSQKIIDSSVDYAKGQQLLAKNEKVYIIESSDQSDIILSVIHTPDSLGAKCRFERGVVQVNRGSWTGHLPNLPNFNLGPIPLPAVDAGANHLSLPACRDTSIALGGAAHNADYLYDWSPSLGLDRTDSTHVMLDASSLAPGESRRYVLTVIDPAKNCRNMATDTITVSREALPAFEKSPDISLCPDSTAMIGVNATLPDWRYEWMPSSGLSDPDIAQPQLTATMSTQYRLFATSPEDCEFFDTVEVRILPANHPDCVQDTAAPGALFIPTVFTPNNDGINDRFVIPSLPPGSALQIFDRWGTRVLTRDNYRNNWQAAGMAEGTYYYVLRLESGKLYRGAVVIMR